MRAPSKTTAKMATVGDIVEINTRAGLAYVQYTHDAGTNGEVVRVLPGLYANRPSDFAELARQKELYFVFYIMDYAIRAGQAEVVSHQSVPEWAKVYPLMRHAAAFDDFGGVIRWRIISAASHLTAEDLIRTPLYTELTSEQKKLSIREIWPHAVMVRQLARGWTPERAEELRLQDVAEAQTKTAGSLHKKQDFEPMTHYLYFPDKPKAEDASAQLRERGFSVEVRKSADGKNWLALATKVPPKSGEQMEELRDELETVAAQSGGKYDGWEASTDSLGSGSAEHGRNIN